MTLEMKEPRTVAAGGALDTADTACIPKITLGSGDKQRFDALVLCLTRGDEITPEPVQWFWRNWLARGKLHVLAGTAGTGKTTLALAMAATVTIGGRWPDGTP